MKPRTSLLSLFLELACADGTDPNDPAPWCYPQWMSSGSGEVPPFHPEYPLPDDPKERRRVEAIIDFVGRYRAAKPANSPDEEGTREALLQTNVAVASARKDLRVWLDKDLKASRINSRFDQVLAEAGLSVFTIAKPNMDSVSA